MHIVPDSAYQQPSSLSNLCLLLAYQAEAVDSKNGFVLELEELTVVTLHCDKLIAAAVVSRVSSLAKTHFELKLLAARVTQATGGHYSEIGSKHAAETTQALRFLLCNSKIDYQQLQHAWECVLRNLGIIADTKGVACVQLVQLDLLGELSEVIKLASAAASLPRQVLTESYPKLSAAVKIACKVLKGQLSVRPRPINANETYMQPRDVRVETSKVTVAGVYLEQRIRAMLAVVKLVSLPSLCMFIIAWSDSADVTAACDGQQSAASVLIGKAAVPKELRSSLTLSAHLLKRQLHTMPA